MYDFIKLGKENIGLAYSCTKDYSLWGSEYHQESNKFLINNLGYRIYAFGVLENKNPVGHAILVDAKPPLSMVDSKNGLYLHCFYISPKHRNKNIGAALIERIEIEAQKEGKEAIFLNTIGIKWMNRDFFEKHGYSMINDDEMDSFMMKQLGKETEYRIIKDFPVHESKTNQLVINHNPLCPLMLYQYSQLAKIAAEELKEIDIIETRVEKASDLSEQFSFGVYFNNLPILLNEKKINETIKVIKSLQIKI
jgi:N-acetylglutamate synthase-like GNAT family acetyltransferase